MTPKIFTPTVTIQKADGRIDIDGNLRLLDALIGAGIKGFLPLGSTGEYPFFKDNEEKKAYLNEYIAAAKGRAELLVGTGGIGRDETVELSNYVLKKGVKGALIISEFYFAMSQLDFYNYYSYLAKHIEGDIYIYNFPARTGSCIGADTVARLAAENPNLKGMKDSILDFNSTAAVMEKTLAVRPDFEMYSGYDNQFISNHRLGGAGGVGALSNIAPKLWARWVKAAAEEDEAGMEAGLRRIGELMPIYALESCPQKLLKEILRREGLDIATHCYFPYDYVQEGSVEKAMELLDEDGAWLA